MLKLMADRFLGNGDSASWQEDLNCPKEKCPLISLSQISTWGQTNFGEFWVGTQGIKLRGVFVSNSRGQYARLERI